MVLPLLQVFYRTKITQSFLNPLAVIKNLNIFKDGLAVGLLSGWVEALVNNFFF